MAELSNLLDGTDIAGEAKAGFESAQRMRQAADARTVALRAREDELVEWMDTITQEWKDKAEELEKVRTAREQSQAVGDSLSDAMDRFDDVLRLNGVEREATP